MHTAVHGGHDRRYAPSLMAELTTAAPTKQAKSVRVEHVSMSFDATPVLSDVCLEVVAGEIVALLGPSGCGKTTLLRTIAGLERPDGGSILIDEEVVTAPGTWVKPEQRQVGMVFQDWALFPHLSVAKNIAYGVDKTARAAGRIDEVLRLVGLEGLADREPATLSGGQQQRVALARALAPRPAVLLLDEPFSNLDSALRVEVRTEVHRLLVSLGITAIFVTHDQEDAFVLGDRVAVMNDAKIEQVDRPHILYRQPSTRWIASFVGNMNLLAATATGTTATTSLGDVDLQHAAAGAVEVVLRPEDIVIGSGDLGVIELIEYYGHDMMALVRLDDASTVQVRLQPTLGWGRGDRVGLTYRGGPATAFVK